jgi:hypothetical protein
VIADVDERRRAARVRVQQSAVGSNEATNSNVAVFDEAGSFGVDLDAGSVVGDESGSPVRQVTQDDRDVAGTNAVHARANCYANSENGGHTFAIVDEVLWSKNSSRPESS